ncbi:SrtB family sortase [Lachnospiraceae bacterium]|nr:class B sortase [uncultured Schaedlerella sp.]NBI56805.1 SrtB family sortase [Lachnospiraceae bacterium]
MSRKKEYILLVILGVIFLAAGGYLFQVWEDYREASAGYQKLKKFIIEKPDVEKDSKGKPKKQEDPEENLPEIDFDGLRAMNGDIVAWIQIPGIGVDYPVVQGKDNEHYLHYTFDRNANKAGSIFLDYRNRADFTDRKVILYGHNMKDGSMFSNLKKYQDAGFRKEQGRVFIYLPEKTLTYEVIECRGVTETNSVYEMDNKEKQMILSTCSSIANIRIIVKCNMEGEYDH